MGPLTTSTANLSDSTRLVRAVQVSREKIEKRHEENNYEK